MLEPKSFSKRISSPFRLFRRNRSVTKLEKKRQNWRIRRRQLSWRVRRRSVDTDAAVQNNVQNDNYKEILSSTIKKIGTETRTPNLTPSSSQRSNNKGLDETENISCSSSEVNYNNDKMEKENIDRNDANSVSEISCHEEYCDNASQITPTDLYWKLQYDAFNRSLDESSSSAHTGSSNCSSSIKNAFVVEESCCLAASAQYYRREQSSTSFGMDSMHFPSFLFEEKGGKNTSCILSINSNTKGRNDVRDDDESSDKYLFYNHHERSSFIESSVTTRRIDSLISTKDSENESQDTFYMMRLHEASFMLPSDAVPSNDGRKWKEGVPKYIFIPSCE